MLLKIILTLGVIVIAFLFVQHRSAEVNANELPTQPRGQVNTRFRIGVYLFIILMALLTAGFFYSQWREANRLVRIELIDTKSGSSSYYQARYGQIKERSFITTDGQRVVVAGTDRIVLEINDQ